MVGIDIVVISRIEKMVQKFGDRALKKFLSKKERRLVTSLASIAGFWAAKEAASKAIGTGIGDQCRFKDIKISKTKKGQPILSYKKRIRKRFKIKNTSLSITHDGGFSIAVVVNSI
jgi:holo-[acyl-carrier protein] synthase